MAKGSFYIRVKNLLLLPHFFNGWKLLVSCLWLLLPVFCAAQQTKISGKVIDAETGEALPYISVSFAGAGIGTSTDSLGRFKLYATKSFSRVVITGIGYQTFSQVITPRKDNQLLIRLIRSKGELREVSIRSGKSGPYHNKDNPAVELIRRVISHKGSNRIQAVNYLQYDQYERISLNLFHIPPALINNFLFRPYRFMIDTVGGQLSAQVYLSEKKYQEYFRLEPEKTIKVLLAQKENNIIKFIDTAGLNIFINRLYGNTIDIYENNVFILNNQFLSPIANHAPDFYKFFITDTIRTGKDSLIELSFEPRTKGDLLFEGRMLVTMDGRYAVTSVNMQVNRQINVNFLKKLDIDLDFEKHQGGRYFLHKSDVKADFGTPTAKGFGVTGERLVYYSNYLQSVPQSADFYNSKSEQAAIGFNKPDSVYWQHGRPDTLPRAQAKFYNNVNRLEQMPSFKRATYIASTLTGGFADLGPFQFNLNELIGYSNVEGLRLGLGGRTTPKFNQSVYFEGYLADGLGDHQLKHQINTYYSFNKTPFYRYPNDYIKISQQYDIGLPGENFVTENFQNPLAAFQTGTSRYYLYSNVFKLDYVKELENHFSFDIGFENLDQQAAGTLVFQLNDAAHTLVNHLTSTEIDVDLRYAPHEQLIQGVNDRTVIVGKYPIFNLQIAKGVSSVFHSSFNYTNLTATIVKRFYLSQLGYADVTLLGSDIIGRVPFPLLNISPANQSAVYDPFAYNRMNYLEFVSDHYAGININQSFNGFFLNKMPLVKHLKWREYLTLKALYGGLRKENDPAYTSGLYSFPVPSANASGTYALGNTPYIEAGVGIGNIFKVLRLDLVRRFNYLDHPNVSQYGIKFSIRIGI